jgi:hypothetical protein
MVSGDSRADERSAVAAVAALEPRTTRVGTAIAIIYSRTFSYTFKHKNIYMIDHIVKSICRW